jgi:predicted site-specific integrase-resolvase
MDKMTADLGPRVKGPEACRMLGDISMEVLKGLVRAGRLPACRLSRKTLIIRVADIEALLAATQVRPAEATA